MVGRLVERGLFDGTFILAFFLIWVAIVTHGLRVRPGGIEIAVAIGVAAVYLMVIARLGIPERSHLFEYGVVAILIYESLTERASRGRRVPAPALLAIVATSSIGAVDECIQAIMPSRVFAWLDMLFNVIAAVMAVVASAALSWARRAASRFGHGSPLIALLALTLCASTYAAAQPDAASPAHPLKELAFLEGSWSGTIDGTLGPATGQRDYRFVLGDRFLLMQHDRNPDDSVAVADRYDEWVIFSFDEEREVIALREFLIEGIVNTYTCELGSEPTRLTCESEFTEGDARLRLRLKLTFADRDSFTEIFEIYRPDGALGVQMEGQWRRSGNAN